MIIIIVITYIHINHFYNLNINLLRRFWGSSSPEENYGRQDRRILMLAGATGCRIVLNVHLILFARLGSFCGSLRFRTQVTTPTANGTKNHFSASMRMCIKYLGQEVGIESIVLCVRYERLKEEGQENREKKNTLKKTQL